MNKKTFKIIKSLAAIAKNARRNLNCIYANNGELIATDSYVVAVVSPEHGSLEDGHYSCYKIKLPDDVEPAKTEDYPDVHNLIFGYRNTNDEKTATLNVKLLEKLLRVCKASGVEYVTVSISDKLKPVFFVGTSDDASVDAAIMPFNL